MSSTIPAMPTVAGFNPTLVRLRRRTSLESPYWRIPFQSHAGSIEAAWAVRVALEVKKSFNPTLVRLRPPYLLRPYFSLPWVSIPRWFD